MDFSQYSEADRAKLAVVAQGAQLIMHDYVQKSSKHCFKTCVTSPGPSLNREQGCLSNCYERFSEGKEITEQTINYYIEKHSGN